MLPPFIPTLRSSRALAALLVVCAAVAWTAVGYDLAELRRLAAVADGSSTARAQRPAHVFTGDVLRTAQLVCLSVTGVFFLVWLHRVRVNARALGVRRLAYRRTWTVLGFLVPLLNALRPYQVIREIWQASDPRGADPVGWQRLRPPRWLALWWGTFVAYLALELLSLGLLVYPLALAHVQMAHAVGVLADTSGALSASLGCFVVWKLSDLQQLKHFTQRSPGVEPDLPCGQGALSAG